MSGGRRVGARRLADEVDRLDRLADAGGRGQLRFFDLLTLAALRIFEEDDVDVAVFEAGIGGRLDATAVLRPRVVVLTGVALDHVDLLGSDERSILGEKLGVAAAGSVVVAAPLDDGLAAHARAEADRRGATLRFVDTGDGSFVERNRLLAVAATNTALATFELPGEREAAASASVLSAPVPGRLERGEADGVEYLLDAAHNEEGWNALMSELAVAGRGGRLRLCGPAAGAIRVDRPPAAGARRGGDDRVAGPFSAGRSARPCARGRRGRRRDDRRPEGGRSARAGARAGAARDAGSVRIELPARSRAGGSQSSGAIVLSRRPPSTTSVVPVT